MEALQSPIPFPSLTEAGLAGKLPRIPFREHGISAKLPLFAKRGSFIIHNLHDALHEGKLLLCVLRSFASADKAGLSNWK